MDCFWLQETWRWMASVQSWFMTISSIRLPCLECRVGSVRQQLYFGVHRLYFFLKFCFCRKSCCLDLQSCLFHQPCSFQHSDLQFWYFKWLYSPCTSLALTAFLAFNVKDFLRGWVHHWDFSWYCFWKWMMFLFDIHWDLYSFALIDGFDEALRPVVMRESFAWFFIGTDLFCRSLTSLMGSFYALSGLNKELFFQRTLFLMFL